MKNKIFILVVLAGLGLGISLVRSDDTDLFLASDSPVLPNITLLFGNFPNMNDLACAQAPGDTSCGVTENGTNFFINLKGTKNIKDVPNGPGGYTAGMVYTEDTSSDDWGWYGPVGKTSGGDTIDAFCAAMPAAMRATCTTNLQTYGYFIPGGTGAAFSTCSVAGGDITTCTEDGKYKCKLRRACSQTKSCGGNKYYCNTNKICYKNLSTCDSNCADKQGDCISKAPPTPIVFTGDLLNYYPPKYKVVQAVFDQLYPDIRNDKSINARVAIMATSGQLGWLIKDFHPPCGNCDGDNPSVPSNFYNLINGMTSNTDAMPLAAGLMGVGQLGANDDTYYQCILCQASGLGSTCTFSETALADKTHMNISGSCGSQLNAHGHASDTMCCGWTCQNSYAIVISGGNMDEGAGSVPTGLTTYHDDGKEQYYLDEVAGWLAQAADFRPNLTSSSACTGSCNYDCAQTVNTFAIGFGIWRNEDVLIRAAQNGGGAYTTANNFDELLGEIKRFIRAIVSKTRTFSAPVLPTVSSSAQFDSYVTSFVPAYNTYKTQLSTFWEGHLRAYEVEITTGGVQFKDACGNPFTGGIVVSASGEQCGGLVVTETVSTPLWDAGECLSEPTLAASRTLCGGSYVQPACYVSPDNRNIYTMRDSDLALCTTEGNTWIPSGGGCGNAIAPISMTTFIISTISATDLGTGGTYPSQTDVVEFIRGGKIDNKDAVLGDIFHSEPEIVNPPGEFISFAGVPGFEGYKDWAEANNVYNRPRILVVGANDGMLHAFNAGSFTCTSCASDENDKNWCLANPGECYDHGTGQELWAYIPNALLSKLKYMLDPPTSTTSGLTNAGVYITNTHIYLVDGSPMVRDVKIPGVDNGLSLSGEARYWHTVVICGLRLGGKRYFALDITNTESPKFLWEFTDPQYMGFTWSQYVPNPASIGPVWVQDSTGIPETRWVTWLNGGLNIDNNTGNPEYSTTETKGRGVFIVDIASGQKLWQFVKGDTGPDGSGYMNYSFPSSIVAFDRDLDLHFDKLFVGDLGGQMWRFDLSPKGTGGKIVSGLVTDDCAAYPNACWTGEPFFKAPLDSTNKVYHGIYYIPATGFDPAGNIRVLFGTGDRMKPNDKRTGIYERFYDIKGQRFGTSILTEDLTDTGGTKVLTDVTDGTPIPGDGIAQYGWYIRLGPDLDPTTPPLGVKVLAPSNLMGGAALWTVYKPYQGGSIECGTATGESLLYLAHYLTGGTFTTEGSLNLSSGRAMELGAGIPSAPVATFLISGGEVLGKLVGSTSDAAITSFSFTQKLLVTHIIYWLEVPRSLHDLIHK